MTVSLSKAAETRDLLKSLDEAGWSNSLLESDESRECDTSLCLSLGSYSSSEKQQQQEEAGSKRKKRIYHELTVALSGPPLHAQHLLTKILRVSDTDKLNRLLIPKKDAERCFPVLKNSSSAGTSGSSSNDEHDKFVVLTFYDENGKAWPLKYTHWDSSESNVFTTGWISYVKQNGLSSGDSVSFFKDLVGSNYYIRHRKKLKTATDESTVLVSSCT